MQHRDCGTGRPYILARIRRCAAQPINTVPPATNYIYSSFQFFLLLLVVFLTHWQPSAPSRATPCNSPASVLDRGHFNSGTTYLPLLVLHDIYASTLTSTIHTQPRILHTSTPGGHRGPLKPRT
jgi:hypothetical protein